jgi:hypothetical protein
MGRALDKQTRAPLPHIEVRLVPDTRERSAVLARAMADSSGGFYLDGPAPGSYRPAFAFPGATLLSAAFVVREDVETFKVLRSPHPDFTRTVRAALPALRFTAAEVNHQRVRQLVQQAFIFCLDQSSLSLVRPDTGRFAWGPRVRPAVCTSDGR